MSLIQHTIVPSARQRAFKLFSTTVNILHGAYFITSVGGGGFVGVYIANRTPSLTGPNFSRTHNWSTRVAAFLAMGSLTYVALPVAGISLFRDEFRDKGSDALDPRIISLNPAVIVDIANMSNGWLFPDLKKKLSPPPPVSH